VAPAVTRRSSPPRRQYRPAPSASSTSRRGGSALQPLADGKRKFMHPVVHRGGSGGSAGRSHICSSSCSSPSPHSVAAARVLIDLAPATRTSSGPPSTPRQPHPRRPRFGIIVTAFFVASAFGGCGVDTPARRPCTSSSSSARSRPSWKATAQPTQAERSALERSESRDQARQVVDLDGRGAADGHDVRFLLHRVGAAPPSLATDP